MTIHTFGIGRIGKDAVTRVTQKGEPVTGFSLAMDEGFGDAKKTHWFDVSGWGKRYEAVAPYLLKGAQVFVDGEQGEREHEGKVYKTLRLNSLELIGGKRDELPKEATPQRGGPVRPAPKTDGFEDSDIPF